MNTSNMTDEEKNIACAKKLGFDFAIEDAGKSVFCGYDGLESTHAVKDFCNSWADAGPIAEKYGIGVYPLHDWTGNDLELSDYWQAESSRGEQAIDKSPTRAIVRCFLEMEIEADD